MAHLPRPLLVAALVLLVSLSGCVGKSDPVAKDTTDPDDTVDGGTTSGDNTTSSGDDKNTRPDPDDPTDDNNTTHDPGDNRTDDPSNNTTVDPTGPTWPAIGDATVRPGVRHSMTRDGVTYWCTTNFVYRSTTTDTLYLGTAAHCVQGLAYGDPVTVYTTRNTLAFDGELAYSSWTAMGFEPDDTTVGDDMHPHDFALIKVPEEHRSKVHPATLHYGGPTALGDLSAIGLGTRVMVYGNSVTRPGIDQTNWENGVVYETHSENKGDHEGTLIYAMVPQAIQGDSGSGLMTKDGKALGAASAATFGLPYGYWTAYSSIPHALAFLKSEGWDLELQTWVLIPVLV